MLRSDEVFSILFVHNLLVKKILRLLFDSSSYIELEDYGHVKLKFLSHELKPRIHMKFDLTNLYYGQAKFNN
jgi:hypothetical protein